jgi:dolichol-phosphate mannosyltransferase
VSKALVVVPTYNEVDNISALLDGILKLPSGFEILVVDDHSLDGTANRVSQRKGMPGGERIHLLLRAGKLGLGTAYCAGFRWALERNYSFVFEMDADLSHNPDDLERLYRQGQTNDLILGSRYMKGGGTEGWSRTREWISRAANIYARLVIGTRIHDMTGGFKCYSQKALLALDIDTLRSEGYAFQIETTTRVLRAGLRVTEIPIIFRERAHGKSKFSKKIIWEAIWTVLRLGATNR